MFTAYQGKKSHEGNPTNLKFFSLQKKKEEEIKKKKSLENDNTAKNTQATILFCIGGGSTLYKRPDSGQNVKIT